MCVFISSMGAVDRKNDVASREWVGAGGEREGGGGCGVRLAV